jgi:cell wall-associated NlpC family hydrolase
MHRRRGVVAHAQGGLPGKLSRVAGGPTKVMMMAGGNKRTLVARAAGTGLLVVALAVSTLTGSETLAAPSQAELDRARDRLMELERDFELVVERYNLVHERLVSIQTQIATTELEVGRIQRKMTVRRSAAVSLATELYKGGTSESYAVVLSSKTIADLDTQLYYLSSSEQAQSQVFERLAVVKHTLDAKVKRLEAARAEAASTQERLAELQEDIESKVAGQKDEIAELNAAIERAERRDARRAAAAAEAAARAAVQAFTPTQVVTPAPAPNPAAQTAVEAALSQVGKPYQWGAAGPDSYDCSGLTMWAWAQAGIGLPHNSGMQYDATPRVAQSDWAPGDLLFFGSPIHHVGMYIGRGQMVEAPYTGSQVRVNSAYRSDYVGAGRPGV